MIHGTLALADDNFWTGAPPLADDNFWFDEEPSQVSTPTAPTKPVPRLYLVETLRDAPAFSARPACAGKADIMDATRGSAVDDAKTICAGCPVIDECRAWVSEEPDYSGVAGGELFTPTTRKKAQQ